MLKQKDEAQIVTKLLSGLATELSSRWTVVNDAWNDATQAETIP